MKASSERMDCVSQNFWRYDSMRSVLARTVPEDSREKGEKILNTIFLEEVKFGINMFIQNTNVTPSKVSGREIKFLCLHQTTKDTYIYIFYRGIFLENCRLLIIFPVVLNLKHKLLSSRRCSNASRLQKLAVNENRLRKTFPHVL